MPATTSLKLPDALHTNAVFGGVDVKAYVMARVKGGKPRRPKALPDPGCVQKK